MAEREAITKAEQMAAALRAEADTLREDVPDAHRTSPEASINETFARSSLPDKSSIDELEDEITVVHDRASEFDRKTFFQQQAERALDEMGVAAKTGAMTLGSIGVGRGESDTSDKRKKEQDRLNRLLTLLDNLRDIDRQIAENNEALDAISRIRALRARGEFDVENEQHRRLLDTAGISVEEYERDGETALERRERELNEENERLQEQRQQQAQELRAEGVTEEQQKALMSSNVGAWREQKVIQASDGTDGIDIDDTHVTTDLSDQRNSSLNIEDELGQFVRDFAGIQKIADEVDRLAAEKALVDGLSEDAQLLALTDDTVKHVFDQGYFDALKTVELETAAPTSPNTGPPAIR